MKKIVSLTILLFLSTSPLWSKNIEFGLEKAPSFFPNESGLEKEKIEWYYLSVPENWSRPEEKEIKIAVALLRCTSEKATADPIVYIAGGPGEESISSLGYWMDNPLRKSSDIILMDVRGTGNSLPALCPDLGREFLKILAKNQDKSLDEQQKVAVTMACQQDLLKKGIDISTYNSTSFARDLNSLKQALKYDKWNVYSVSYGTYIAQVYAHNFPGDIHSLILDSPISNITEYYNQNTENFMSSLRKVFEQCENDPLCNSEYPDLEATFYQTVEQITRKPITVAVDTNIIATGTFTYNAEDFKIVAQQALYQKKLIEILPLLITQFNKENKGALGALVQAFAQRLSIDYGHYYSVTCNEVIPANSVEIFDKRAAMFRGLNGGLSFYRSDFMVCDQWNGGRSSQALMAMSDTSVLAVPVLVISGKFDPITPETNALQLKRKYKNISWMQDNAAGHAPTFTPLGTDAVVEFILNPGEGEKIREIKVGSKIHLVNGVAVNGGVINFANSLGDFEFLFFLPFIIALVIVAVTIPTLLYSLVKNFGRSNVKLLYSVIIVASLVVLIIITGLFIGVQETAETNYYILAFGLLSKYRFIYNLLQAFFILTIVALFLYLFLIRKLNNSSIIFSILFSLILLNVYFVFWGLQ